MHAHDIHHIVEQLHAAPHRLVYEFAGAGSLALWWLHHVGGSSRTVLEATDRYAAASLTELLGTQPGQVVSVETALAMARQAYRRALHLAAAHAEAVPLLGVACTAAIATDYAKRGQHQCAVAVQAAGAATVHTLRLTKGQRDRATEEALVGRVLINAVAGACGLAPALPLDLRDNERVETRCSSDALRQLLDGTLQCMTFCADGRWLSDAPFSGALLSGSFNPLHAGHLRLLDVAARVLQRPVAAEISVIHPDKGTLALQEVQRRLAQFQAVEHTVMLSRAAMYGDKAQQFPGSVLIVGYDTAARILQPHYYGGVAGLHASLEQVRRNGCRFLVAGRLQDEHFATLDDLTIPDGFADLFVGLGEEHFRVDISSTALRDAG
jgi:hypothetical protein